MSNLIIYKCATGYINPLSGRCVKPTNATIVKLIADGVQVVDTEAPLKSKASKTSKASKSLVSEPKPKPRAKSKAKYIEPKKIIVEASLQTILVTDPPDSFNLNNPFNLEHFTSGLNILLKNEKIDGEAKIFNKNLGILLIKYRVEGFEIDVKRKLKEIYSLITKPRVIGLVSGGNYQTSRQEQEFSVTVALIEERYDEKEISSSFGRTPTYGLGMTGSPIPFYNTFGKFNYGSNFEIIVKITMTSGNFNFTPKNLQELSKKIKKIVSLPRYSSEEVKISGIKVTQLNNDLLIEGIIEGWNDSYTKGEYKRILQDLSKPIPIKLTEKGNFPSFIQTTLPMSMKLEIKSSNLI